MNNELNWLIEYVLEMICENKLTALRHSLENLKTAMPYIDYFKRDAFLKDYLEVKEENTDAE